MCNMSTAICSNELPAVETSYGILKRFRFVEAAIKADKPKTVLDIGCGTGAHLAYPLAERHSHTNFYGADSDTASIAFAKENFVLPNLRFSDDLDSFPEQRFQMIIASEVLEHVEDPLEFLSTMRSSLADGGKVLLTVPNGYGPAELAAFAEALLHLTGVFQVARALFRLISGKRPLFPKKVEASAETLASSPHINFFSYGALNALISASGFRVSAFQSRTLLCGLLFDQLIRKLRLQEWNASFADRVPAVVTSDWMYVLEPANGPSPFTCRRGPVARLRRYLNEKRFGLR